MNACTIDWGALAAWVQAGIFAFATVIAAIQLCRYNSMETYKQTEQLLRDYEGGVEEHYITLVGERLLQTNSLKYPKPTPDERGHMLHLSMFFHQAQDLYYRGIIDKEAYMHHLAVPTVHAWYITTAIRKQYRTLRVRSFKRLAQDAYKWILKMGLDTKDYADISFDDENATQ